MMRNILGAILFLLLAALSLSALAEAPLTVDIGTLEPTTLTVTGEAPGLTPLFCGPTQGFFRRDDLCLDTGKPFTYFGQYDCWAMVAQGTPDSFGPVGWVEAALLAELPAEPLLAFEDGLQVTVEAEAVLTNDPLNPDAELIVRIVPGTVVTLLAACGDFAYIQAEFSDLAPVRAFIPMSAIE